MPTATPIFETNAKTDITNADKETLDQILKNSQTKKKSDQLSISSRLFRYFVVHNCVCNGDSYTGSMTHNYYLYEKDGQMAMIMGL